MDVIMSFVSSAAASVLAITIIASLMCYVNAKTNVFLLTLKIASYILTAYFC